MKRLSLEEARKLLKKYARDGDSFKKILEHSEAVRKVAKSIAKDIKDIDLDFVEGAALLHDIGRFQIGPKGNNVEDVIKHGVYGGKILRKEGLDDYASVAERHLGAGISREDIEEQSLDLPSGDYIPVSREEKIITHADNLIFGDMEGSVEETVERFRKELGEKAGKRVKKLADEVEGMKEKN
ncbi:MAG: HD domain-containing protein [Nanoarchaeota archaeon]|nr:HD domain-containing protein [Nanoarchaeota archaeon]